jgi:hypothetical protein
VPAGKLGRQPASASQSFGYVVLDGPVWVGPVGPDGGTPLTTPGSVGPGVASRVEPGEDRCDAGLDRRQINFLDLHSQIGPRHRLGADRGDLGADRRKIGGKRRNGFQDGRGVEQRSLHRCIPLVRD